MSGATGGVGAAQRESAQKKPPGQGSKAPPSRPLLGSRKRKRGAIIDDSDQEDDVPRRPDGSAAAVQDDLAAGQAMDDKGAAAAPRSFFSRAGRLTRQALERLAESLHTHGPWALTHPSENAQRLPAAQRPSLFATTGLWGLQDVRDHVAVRLRRRAYRTCLAAGLLDQPAAESSATSVGRSPDESGAAGNDSGNNQSGARMSLPGVDHDLQQASVSYLSRTPLGIKHTLDGTSYRPVRVNATRKNLSSCLTLAPIVKEFGLVSWATRGFVCLPASFSH